jgi:signal transduction histidine kinase
MEGPGSSRPFPDIRDMDRFPLVEAVRKRWVPLLLGALGLAIALMLFAYVRDDIERDAVLRFERQAGDAKHIIERRLHAYVGVTYGLGALFGSNDAISRIEFHRYVAALDLERNYPGFEVLNFARHVRGAEKDGFEAKVRADGYPRFAVRPPGERLEYHVLEYLEPMNRNRFAFGLDIVADATQAAGIARRRDTGELYASGRLLNVGPDKSVGLAMRLPVYRNDMPIDTVAERRAAFLGTVGAGYNVRKLMAGVLQDTTMTSMRYRFYDMGAISEPIAVGAGQVLLYDSAQPAPGAPSDDFMPPGAEVDFGAELPLSLAGRNWKLQFNAPRGAFVQRSDALLPWLVLAGGVLCSALLFAVVYAFASARERAVILAEEISAQAVEAQRANAAQIRDLLRRLVFAQETERRRFSADLHDMVGQSLTVIGMGIETLRRLLSDNLPEKADATCDEMSKLLKETMGSVRAVMSDLRPPLLDDYGLYAAIEWHARQMAARTGLRIEVGGTRLEPRPATEVEVALFRIAQEALTNVVKHADAKQARVSLLRDIGRVRLVVEDDGRGVVPAANDIEALGWGMAVMRERAAAVGGAMRIESSRRGTRIVVEVGA